MKLIIDKPLTSLNEYINAERGNKYKAAAIKKTETEYCRICAKNQLKPVTSYPVDVLVKWYTTDRKDHDNISFGFKFIGDGLVNAGIIENDGPKQIRNISHEFVKSKKEWCEVWLLEI